MRQKEGNLIRRLFGVKNILVSTVLQSVIRIEKGTKFQLAAAKAVSKQSNPLFDLGLGKGCAFVGMWWMWSARWPPDLVGERSTPAISREDHTFIIKSNYTCNNY